MTAEPAEAAKLRQAFAATSRSDAPGAECPPAEKIWEGVRGESSPGELRALLRHIALCAVCTEAWRLGAKLDGGSSPRTSLRIVGSRVAAAAAVVLLAVGLLYWRPEVGGPGTTRSGSSEGASREPAIELASAPALPRDDFLLEWRVVRATGGLRHEYTVEIRLEAGEQKLLGRAGPLEEPTFRVPAEWFEDVASGAELRVAITAATDLGYPFTQDFLVRIR